MKSLPVVAVAALCLAAAACSPKQENVERPDRPPTVVPGPPAGSSVFDPPNQLAK
jgi:hypothetical protein